VSDERDNPFAPPKAPVLEPEAAQGDFVAEGRKLPAGRGVAWFSEAWDLFKASPGTWILIFIVFALISLVFAVIPLGSLVTSICYPVAAAGLMLGCRDLEQGASLTVGHLFRGFSKNVSNLLLVGVLYLVGALAVGVIVGIGMALAMPFFMGSGPVGTGMDAVVKMAPVFALVVLVALALMLPLFMAMWFAPAIVVFHDVQPMAAMRASFKGCLRNFVPFLLYGIVGIVILVVALIPFGLGLLVAAPLTWITMYTGYRDIFLER
jgi:uncharacterized membrane protein